MTDARQDGPDPTATAKMEEKPQIKRDPLTGINRDMSAHPSEAGGHPRNHEWKNDHT